MPRNPDEFMLFTEISVRDRIMCDELKAACALDGDANLVRAALFHFACFVLGKAAVDCGTFALRGAGRSRRRQSAGIVRARMT